ncbi:MAG: hypothetical protein PHW24_01980 [Candidatus Moranbacteria bacterium]|nr:hypothetical protein [Candidatus Moranbacteria bacterium]
MKCKQKHRNGKGCKYEADSGSQFCYVHNPSLLPVFFIGSVDSFERSNYETDLPIEKAQAYIDAGFALKMDYAFRVKMEKTVLRLITKLTSDRLKDVKEYIANDDKTSLADFFRESPTNSSAKVLEFINNENFNKKEQIYLNKFLESLRA